MKSITMLWTLLASGLVLTVASAKPLDEVDSYKSGLRDKVRQPVTAPSQGAAVDDYVLALGKNLHHNFLLDAGEFPPDEYVQPFRATAEARARPWPSYFSSVLGDFVEAHEVAKLAYDESTYLLWRRPDALAAARLVAASARYQQPQTVRDPHKLALTLYAFFKHANPALDNKPITATLDQLPPDVRADFVAAARRAVQHPSFHVDQILSDEFWKTARMRIGSAPGRGGNVSDVYFGGGRVGGESGLFFTPFFEGIYFENQDPFPLDSTIALPLADFIQADQQREGENNAAPENAAPVVGAPATIDFEYIPPSVGLTWEQLSSEVAFKAPLTADWHRVPLAKVLAEVSKKYGVTLSLAKELERHPLLVTAHVEVINAATLMGALARLYKLQWEKTADKTFVLKPRALDALQEVLLRSADGTLLRQDRVDESVKDKIQRIVQLKQDILDELTALKVHMHQEVPFAVLSEGLQQSIKSEAQYWAATDIMNSMASYMIRPNTPIYLLRTSPVHDDFLFFLARCQLSTTRASTNEGAFSSGFIVRAVPPPPQLGVMIGPGAIPANAP